MNNKQQITITVSRKNYDKMEKLRGKVDWSRSLFIRECMREYLEKYKGDLL